MSACWKQAASTAVRAACQMSCLSNCMVYQVNKAVAVLRLPVLQLCCMPFRLLHLPCWWCAVHACTECGVVPPGF